MNPLPDGVPPGRFELTDEELEQLPVADLVEFGEWPNEDIEEGEYVAGFYPGSD